MTDKIEPCPVCGVGAWRLSSCESKLVHDGYVSEHLDPCDFSGCSFEVGGIAHVLFAHLAQSARRAEQAEAALQPFAKALENDDPDFDNAPDNMTIWETSIAMGIDIGHMRKAKEVLDK